VDLEHQVSLVKMDHQVPLELLVSAETEHPDQLDHQVSLAEMVKTVTPVDLDQLDQSDQPDTQANLEHLDTQELKG